MALRDFWRRRDEPERTRFPLDPLSRDSWQDETEARYGQHLYRNHPSFHDESQRFNDRWQNSYSGPGYQRFGGSRDDYGGSSDNPFLGERPLTRAGSMYDSGYFGHGNLPKTPWLGEAEGREYEEHRYGTSQERQLSQERQFGEFSGRGPRGYRRSDDRIKEDVCQCLTDDPHIDASNIDVTVNDREVVLSGTVESRFEKRHAEDLIERIPGVRDVINSLRVTAR
jgi:osmotically-inducible protein OsmY